MNDITSPLRLAVGSHKAGTGKGCAMNVISWENGDKTITDYPSCSARPLAQLVQRVNDNTCSHRDGGDLLCPDCSQVVLELGHATVGTAGATREQEAAWVAELLDSPEWGCVRHTKGTAREAVTRVAGMFRARAAGREPSCNEWNAAAAYAADAADATTATYTAAAYSAANAAYSAANAAAAANAATYAAYSASYAAYSASYTRTAIAAWHRICGTAPSQVPAEVVEAAVKSMCLVKHG